MKAKIIALFIICTSAVSLFSGCSDGNSELSEPTTVASNQPTTETMLTHRDDISYVASYDKENKKINTTLTNNTCDDVIFYGNTYNLYKKVENGWESKGFEYATYAMGYYLFPYPEMNSIDHIHSAYNTAGENINFTEEKEKGGLDAGEYKITMTFDVYPESEGKPIPHNEDETISIENPDGKYLNASKAKHEEVVVGADFTVE